MKELRIGMAGLDTSHVPAFSQILNDPSNRYHVPGGKVTVAFPGGSADFSKSADRVDQFTNDLRDHYGVEMVDSFSDLEGKCDAVMLESIDGRVHLDQFRTAAEWGIPVFIDKPMTISSADALEISRIAGEKNVRVTSASAVRFAEKFQQALNGKLPVFGADFHGPMALIDKCPGYFWYGIHIAEMLFAALGVGCREVLAIREGAHDIVVGRWMDGRMGILRGNRVGNNLFGGIIHREDSSRSFQVSLDDKPYYASMLDEIIPFFRGEGDVVPLAESVEIIRFLEAADESVSSRQWVAL